MTIQVLDATGAVKTINTLPDPPYPTQEVMPTAPVFGQVKIAATGTAVNLPAGALQDELIIHSAITNNGANASVGGVGVNNTRDGTGNGYILEPGASTILAVDNANRVWINGTIGDIFSYMGS